MSTYSEQDYLNPNDPTYYAPRWLRERSKLRLIPPSETSSERPGRPVSSSPPFNGLLEEAVPEALLRPLDPEVIHEPPGFVRELDRRIALISVSSRRRFSPRGVVLRHHGACFARSCPATGRRCFVPLWHITIDKNRLLSAASERRCLEARSFRVSDNPGVNANQPDCHYARAVRNAASTISSMASKTWLNRSTSIVEPINQRRGEATLPNHGSNMPLRSLR